MIGICEAESQFVGESAVDTGHDSEGKCGLSVVVCEKVCR